MQRSENESYDQAVGTLNWSVDLKTQALKLVSNRYGCLKRPSNSLEMTSEYRDSAGHTAFEAAHLSGSNAMIVDEEDSSANIPSFWKQEDTCKRIEIAKQGQTKDLWSQFFAPLPDELLMCILFWIPTRDLSSVALVCSKWAVLINSNTFWRMRVFAQWPHCFATSTLSLSWPLSNNWGTMFNHISTIHNSKLPSTLTARTFDTCTTSGIFNSNKPSSSYLLDGQKFNHNIEDNYSYSDYLDESPYTPRYVLRAGSRISLDQHISWRVYNGIRTAYEKLAQLALHDIESPNPVLALSRTEHDLLFPSFRPDLSFDHLYAICTTFVDQLGQHVGVQRPLPQVIATIRNPQAQTNMAATGNVAHLPNQANSLGEATDFEDPGLYLFHATFELVLQFQRVTIYVNRLPPNEIIKHWQVCNTLLFTMALQSRASYITRRRWNGVITGYIMKLISLKEACSVRTETATWGLHPLNNIVNLLESSTLSTRIDSRKGISVFLEKLLNTFGKGFRWNETMLFYQSSGRGCLSEGGFGFSPAATKIFEVLNRTCACIKGLANGNLLYEEMLLFHEKHSQSSDIAENCAALLAIERLLPHCPQQVEIHFDSIMHRAIIPGLQHPAMVVRWISIGCLGRLSRSLPNRVSVQDLTPLLGPFAIGKNAHLLLCALESLTALLRVHTCRVASQDHKKLHPDSMEDSGTPNPEVLPLTSLSLPICTAVLGSLKNILSIDILNPRHVLDLNLVRQGARLISSIAAGAGPLFDSHWETFTPLVKAALLKSFEAMNRNQKILVDDPTRNTTISFGRTLTESLSDAWSSLLANRGHRKLTAEDHKISIKSLIDQPPLTTPSKVIMWRRVHEMLDTEQMWNHLPTIIPCLLRDIQSLLSISGDPIKDGNPVDYDSNHVGGRTPQPEGIRYPNLPCDQANLIHSLRAIIKSCPPKDFFPFIRSTLDITNVIFIPSRFNVSKLAAVELLRDIAICILDADIKSQSPEELNMTESLFTYCVTNMFSAVSLFQEGADPLDIAALLHPATEILSLCPGWINYQISAHIGSVLLSVAYQISRCDNEAAEALAHRQDSEDIETLQSHRKQAKKAIECIQTAFGKLISNHPSSLSALPSLLDQFPRHAPARLSASTSSSKCSQSLQEGLLERVRQLIRLPSASAGSSS